MRFKLVIPLEQYAQYTLGRLIDLLGWRRKERVMRFFLDYQTRGSIELKARYFTDYLILMAILAGKLPELILIFALILAIKRRDIKGVGLKLLGAFRKHKPIGLSITLIDSKGRIKKKI